MAVLIKVESARACVTQSVTLGDLSAASQPTDTSYGHRRAEKPSALNVDAKSPRHPRLILPPQIKLPDLAAVRPKRAGTAPRRISYKGSCPRAIITAKDAIEIYMLGVEGQGINPTASQLASRYGITAKGIRDIWNRRTWFSDTRPFWPTSEDRRFERRKICSKGIKATPLSGYGPGRPLGSLDSRPRLPKFSRLLPSTDVQPKNASYTPASKTFFKSASQPVATNAQRTYATRSAVHTEMACDIQTAQDLIPRQVPRPTCSPYSWGSRSPAPAASPAAELVYKSIGASSSSAFHMPASTTTSGTPNIGFRNGVSKHHAASSSHGRRPSARFGFNISFNAEATYFNGGPAASGNTIVAIGQAANQAQTHSSDVLTDVYNPLYPSDTFQHVSGGKSSSSVYAAVSPTFSTRSMADTVPAESPVRAKDQNFEDGIPPIVGDLPAFPSVQPLQSSGILFDLHEPSFEPDVHAWLCEEWEFNS